MKNNWPGRAGLCAALAAAALLAACSTPKHAMRDAQKQLATYQELRELPQANLNLYSQALQRLGYMLNVYKSGDPVLYVQSRTILDSTNLSSPLAGAEIPGDVTEMVRTALNRIGAKVVYVPYHPDYLVAQAQLGGQFGVTMPDYLITGALTEFDRALSGAGRANNASVEFGKGHGSTALGYNATNVAIYSALALDLNVVNFQTQQMVPRMQSSNVVKVLDMTSERNASLGFYGDAFGFKTEGKYMQGRHSAIRTLVDLSVLEIVGKVTNTPYWRTIPNGHPDPVVVENMRNAFEALSPQVRIGLAQVMLQKYQQPVQVTQQLDAPTAQAVAQVYAAHFPQLGAQIDLTRWEHFEPLFFNVPMPWDEEFKREAALAEQAAQRQAEEAAQRARTQAAPVRYEEG